MSELGNLLRTYLDILEGDIGNEALKHWNAYGEPLPWKSVGHNLPKRLIAGLTVKDVEVRLLEGTRALMLPPIGSNYCTGSGRYIFPSLERIGLDLDDAMEIVINKRLRRLETKNHRNKLHMREKRRKKSHD